MQRNQNELFGSIYESPQILKLAHTKSIIMKIISLSEVEKKEVHMEGAVGAWRQLPLGSGDGTPVYSFRVFTVEPGG